MSYDRICNAICGRSLKGSSTEATYQLPGEVDFKDFFPNSVFHNSLVVSSYHIVLSKEDLQYGIELAILLGSYSFPSYTPFFEVVAAGYCDCAGEPVLFNLLGAIFDLESYL